MENRYRVCLIGCGRMGATIDDEVRDRPDSDLFLPYSHAAAIAACGRVEFAGVCDPIAEKAGAARERYGARQSFTDYETMIREVQPDIVCIATRPSAHAPASIFAAEQGVRGIYCEKPLCNSMVEADAMLQALETRGVKFNYGTQRRYVSLYRNLRAMTDAGDIGEVQAVIAHCGSSAAQWGHTHTADMLLFLSGDGEVEFLQGAAEIDDAAWEGDTLKQDAPISMGYARFANGVHAYLVASGGYEFEVSGTGGKLRTLSNGIGYSWRRLDEHGQLQDASGPEMRLESGTLRGLEDLVRALDEDGDTQGNLRLACRSQEMIFGFTESHRRGGMRVPMPLANRELAIAPDNY